MMRLRALVSLLAAALLAVASVTAAGARGQAMSAGEVVVCAGGQAVTLRLDAEGNPVGPVHVCPDCVLTLLAAPAPPGPQALCVADWLPLSFDPARAATAVAADPPPPNARAPPPCP